MEKSIPSTKIVRVWIVHFSNIIDNKTSDTNNIKPAYTVVINEIVYDCRYQHYNSYSVVKVGTYMMPTKQSISYYFNIIQFLSFLILRSPSQLQLL